MAKAPPSFDFYYNDWIGGTKHLSHAARSCYLDLLMFQFQNGAIPERKLAMMQLCGITDQGQWDSIWDEIKDKFEPIDDTRRGNVKMDETRQKAIRRWERNRVNGQSGGRPKQISENPAVSSGLTQTKPKRNPPVNPEVDSGLTQTKPTGKEEDGRRKKEEEVSTLSSGMNSSRNDQTLETPPARTEAPSERFPARADRSESDFGRSQTSEVDEKPLSSSRDARRDVDWTPVSTEPHSDASTGLLGVRGKPKKSFFPDQSRPCLADLMVGNQPQTVNLPKSHATERCAKAVQQWLDYCDSMGKLPQIMSLEQQLVDCANKNRSEDGFIDAIKRTIRDNCDPYTFRPKIWSQELKFHNAKIVDEDPQYLTPAQLRAGGAI